MKSFTESPNTYTRIAGLCYLLIIVLGVIGQLFVRDALINYDDATQTAQNILEAQGIWRLGVTADIFMQVLDIPVMIILYHLLKPVNKLLALISVAFNMAQTAVLIANKLIMLAPLVILNSSQYSSVFSQQQISSQVLLLADLHDYGFGIGLIFFGFATIGYGALIIKSSYLPTFIGAFMMIAGVSYLINSFTLLIAPSLSELVFPVLLLSFVGELCFALWLLFKGIDIHKWGKITSQH